MKATTQDQRLASQKKVAEYEQRLAIQKKKMAERIQAGEKIILTREWSKDSLESLSVALSGGTSPKKEN